MTTHVLTTVGAWNQIFRRQSWLGALLLCVSWNTLAAQDAADGMVRLDIGEEVDLKVLVDTVSRELGVSILYDAKIAREKVFLRAPREIPRSSLLTLLQSALYMRGLLLAEAGAPGWLKIVETQKLAEAAVPGAPGGPLDRFQGAAAVTQVFEIRHAKPSELDALVRGFVTAGGNHVVLDRQRLLIVTDYVPNLERIRELIERIDRPLPGQRMEFVPVEHLRAEELAEQLAPIMEARFRSPTAAGGAAPAAKSVEVFADARSNQLIVVGESSEVDEVLKLAERFDVSVGLSTRIYPLRHLSAERADRLVGSLINPDGENSNYRSTVDADDNLLIIYASQTDHQ